MNEKIKNIVDELEEKVDWHKRLAWMYEGQEDLVAEQTHYAAAFSYERAIQIIKKYTNKEGMLKLVK